MLEIPTSIGYLRSDVSGVRQSWDEIRLRSTAARLGYTLAKTIVFGPYTDDPVQRLIDVVWSVDAEAVIVPSLDHLGGEVPATLLAVADTITVDPQETFSRWIIPPGPATDTRVR
ncbi:hypothetical protein OHB26_12030 [Nocardia sp. NBC_01503]|uniref:hypothetical protein n=1 Tax=Nocardia sp. NBC_01503 TaxID=2975997 RepID=UPI002E7BF862|nr:hypothetical protein [Nocardia sp. NBC_01503]WTL34853.1 hypothetical protein OHB26_12030 [Nocardia sp. NBC_01503]